MNIIELAQECKLVGEHPHLAGIYLKSLERFAKLVAAQEREECAKIIKSHGPFLANGAMLAAAIEARSNT